MLALCSAGPMFESRSEDIPKQPTFVVRRPTILAFFPPVTPKQLDQDPDTNEVLSDFQLYARQARGPFSKLGVDFEEVYARSFRVTSARRTTTFHPGGPKIGYYFVAPGKRPRIEYGVETDGDLRRIAAEYFGVVAK